MVCDGYVIVITVALLINFTISKSIKTVVFLLINLLVKFLSQNSSNEPYTT